MICQKKAEITGDSYDFRYLELCCSKHPVYVERMVSKMYCYNCRVGNFPIKLVY